MCLSSFFSPLPHLVWGWDPSLALPFWHPSNCLLTLPYLVWRLTPCCAWYISPSLWCEHHLALAATEGSFTNCRTSYRGHTAYRGITEKPLVWPFPKSRPIAAWPPILGLSSCHPRNILFYKNLAQCHTELWPSHDKILWWYRLSFSNPSYLVCFFFCLSVWHSTAPTQIHSFTLPFLWLLLSHFLCQGKAAHSPQAVW